MNNRNIVPTDPEEHSAIAIEFKNLSVKNDRRRTHREWAVRNITFATNTDQRTLVYGLPQSGKSTLMDAIIRPDKYPERVAVHVKIQELFLKESHSWKPREYAAKYDPTLLLGAYLVVDDAFDQAVPYLVRLDRGMLMFAGVDGEDCFHRFDRLLYLHDGLIHFDGTPRAFFDWVKATRPQELQFRLADHLIDSGGEMPGCPELDE